MHFCPLLRSILSQAIGQDFSIRSKVLIIIREKTEAKKKDFKWIYFSNLVRESSGEFDRMIMDLDLTILNLLAKKLNLEELHLFCGQGHAVSLNCFPEGFKMLGGDVFTKDQDVISI